MVVTRSMSGATKKADTKVSVNHKAAERARKKAAAEAERERKITAAEARFERKNLARLEKVIRAIRMNDEQLLEKAAGLYVSKMFIPQYLKKHPGSKYNLKAVWSGYHEFYSLADSDKDPYCAMAKKREEEEIALAEDWIMNPHKTQRSMRQAQ